MALSLSVSSLLLSILLAFLLLKQSHATPSSKPTNELINSICSTTLNPSSCVQALKSDPRSASADLKGLGRISIDLAQSNAKATYNILGSLTKKTIDPKLKERYDTCHENYGDAIILLNQAKQFLSSGDYASLNARASATSDDANTCNDNFEGGPPAEPSQLRQANQKLNDLCGIILVISLLLK